METKTKTKKTTNRGARACVQTLQPFTNSNGQLYARWVNPNTYVVYSYGKHWPLFIWDASKKTWFENEDRYSSTTSHHRSYTHPYTKTEPKPCAWMQERARA